MDKASTNDSTSRNVRLGYVVVVCNNLFFWYAPWLLFMLNYVSFGQVAVIGAFGLATRIVAEVPSGAVSDLLGKKRALFLAFLCTSIGEALFIIQPSFEMFAISFVITNLGYSFYSGTIDAFFYDTLLGGKQEGEYPRLLSRQQAFTNGAIALASVLGGLAYHFWLILPWLLTVAAKLVGLVVTLQLDEPKVDTDTFSWSTFVFQTRRGFAQLLAKGM
jgi:MFS family permease